MTMPSSHGEFIKAVVSGDTSRADQLNEQIPESERQDFHLLVSAFFSIMLELQFKADSSPQAIKSFVDQMRYDFRNAEPPIKPLVIEGLIRASCGEEQFFDEISAPDSFRAEFQVITKITNDHPDVVVNIDAHLSDANLLVSEWLSQED